MAEEFVSKDQFEEFIKRMEQGMEQGNRHIDDMRGDVRQMRNWIIGLYGIVVFGFVGSIFITIIKKTIS